MARVTEADIYEINRLYLEVKTYAGVARLTGFAPTTVKKYILPNFAAKPITKFCGETKLDLDLFKIPIWNDLISLSDEEKKEMNELRKEVNM